MTGKYALITGSSRGVGQQIALGLADLGCNIIVHGRTVESCKSTVDLLQNKNVEVHTVTGDFLSESNVHDVINQVKKLIVSVDILYNNAAIMTEYKNDYWDHSWEEWMDTMKVNVFAMHTLCRAFVPNMIAKDYGRVVNLISGIDKVPELEPYSASKWAVIKMTEDIASKVDNTNVRINSLDPGWLRTDMGTQDAPNSVTDVLPGALQPVLIDSNGPNGSIYRALDYHN